MQLLMLAASVVVCLLLLALFSFLLLAEAKWMSRRSGAPLFYYLLSTICYLLSAIYEPKLARNMSDD